MVCRDFFTVFFIIILTFKLIAKTCVLTCLPQLPLQWRRLEQWIDYAISKSYLQAHLGARGSINKSIHRGAVFTHSSISALPPSCLCAVWDFCKGFSPPPPPPIPCCVQSSRRFHFYYSSLPPLWGVGEGPLRIGFGSWFSVRCVCSSS